MARERIPSVRSAAGIALRRIAIALLALCSAGAAMQARADGRLCIGNDVVTFGDRPVGSKTTASTTVANCGDQTWSFTDVSIDPATGNAFEVNTSCATGAALAPGAACTVTVLFAPLSPGQTSGGLWLRNTTSTPDVLFTFYGRGVDAQAGTATLEFVPAGASFAAQPVGTQSAPLAVELHNLGPQALTPTAIVLNGPEVYDFFGLLDTCRVGTSIAPGQACRISLFFRPQAPGTRLANLVIDAPQLASLAILPISGIGATAMPWSADVIEFYNAAFNHYFLTTSTDEAAAIDRGAVGPGWARTGFGFHAWTLDGPAPPAVAVVCRFFGIPGIGPNSHFFTVNPAECDAVKASPYWLFEGLAFRMLPALGACAADADTVLRFYWPGNVVTELRHRYVADAVEAARMRAGGWTEEGPVFCSPR